MTTIESNKKDLMSTIDKLDEHKVGLSVCINTSLEWNVARFYFVILEFLWP